MVGIAMRMNEWTSLGLMDAVVRGREGEPMQR